MLNVLECNNCVKRAVAIRERRRCALLSAISDLFVRYGNEDPVKGASAERPCFAPNGSIGAQAQAAMLSRSHFSRKIRAELGLTPRDYRRQQRVRAARVLIEQGRALAETAAETGFADQAHMTRQMRAILGVTPGALRKQPG